MKRTKLIRVNEPTWEALFAAATPHETLDSVIRRLIGPGFWRSGRTQAGKIPQERKRKMTKQEVEQARTGTEVSPLYRDAAKAQEKRTQLLNAHPYCDFTLKELPTLKRWVVTKVSGPATIFQQTI